MDKKDYLSDDFLYWLEEIEFLLPPSMSVHEARMMFERKIKEENKMQDDEKIVAHIKIGGELKPMTQSQLEALLARSTEYKPLASLEQKHDDIICGSLRINGIAYPIIQVNKQTFEALQKDQDFGYTEGVPRYCYIDRQENKIEVHYLPNFLRMKNNDTIMTLSFKL